MKKYGKIETIELRKTGRVEKRGFAFVTFGDIDTVDKLLFRNSTLLMGIIVK